MRVRKAIVATTTLACLLIAVMFLGYAFVQHRAPYAREMLVAKESRSASHTVSAGIDYVGYWCDSANATGHVMSRARTDQLEVVSFDGNSLLFTVMHTGAAPAYRITSSEDTVTAPVVQGVARVDFRDDRGGTNRATIQLIGDRILVRIVELRPADNGSLSMDVVMLRDLNHDTRVVDESASPDPANVVQQSYYTPLPGSLERRSLMDAARKTFGSEKPEFVVHELYVQGTWAVGTLDVVGDNHAPPYENVYVWRRADAKWTCLQGCGDVGELSLDDIRDSIRAYGVPANLVAAISFK